MKEVMKSDKEKQKEDMDIIEEAFIVDDAIILSMRKQIEDYEKVLKGFQSRNGELLSQFSGRVQGESIRVLAKWKKKLKHK